MKCLILDTDVASYLYGKRPEASKYKRHLRNAVPALAFMSVAELHFGAHRNEWSEPRVIHLDAYIGRFLMLPFDDRLPRLCARLRAHAASAGHPLARPENSNDLWTAACAIQYEAPLLTGNVRRFVAFPGLELLDADG
jgi:predicted nucleic acid-binding protein